MSILFRSILVVVLSLPPVMISATASAAPDGRCGVRVDLPHVSRTTSAQIHTRVESFCRNLPVLLNQVEAVSYRSRWFGWEEMGRATAGPAPRDLIRVTVAVDCEPETKYRWRTVAHGVATIGGETYTAAAFEETSAEIVCRS